MLRVMINKPKINYVPAHNDMSSFHPTYFQVTGEDWFWMGIENYLEKRNFEDFDLNLPEVPKEQIQELINSLIKEEDLNPMPQTYLCLWFNRLRFLLKQSGNSQIWQFNSMSKDLNSWVRNYVILGEKRLQRVSWLTCYIKIPILKTFCKVLNFCLYFKNKKEIREWEDFLNKGHSNE